MVANEGVKPYPAKISAINFFPIPESQKDIKSFQSLFGYYRRFILDFAKITEPLTSCLKKDSKISYTNEFIQAFKHCKTLLINDPIL